MRDTFSNEHAATSISERWQTVDSYFECITECDFEDKVCVTKCMVTHLNGGQEDNTKAL